MAKYEDKLLKAQNLTGGVRNILLQMLKEYGVGNSCCLFAEKQHPSIESIFHEWFTDIELGYVGSGSSNYTLDLNLPLKIERTYDSIYNQSLLEHVCNPLMAITNMANLCNIGGTIVIHTHNRNMKLHRHPIDCLRFMPDFFQDITRYIDIELLDQHQGNRSNIFVAYRRIPSKKDP